MNKTEKIFIIIFSVLVLVFLTWLMYNLLGPAKGSYSQTDYERALASENKKNPCATPSGYTDEEWKEHMSHHPEQYKECLK